MTLILDQNLSKYIEKQDSQITKILKIIPYINHDVDMMNQIEDELECIENLITEEMENPDHSQSESWNTSELKKLCKESYTLNLYNDANIHFKAG